MSDITKIKVDGEPESSYQLYPRNEEFSKRSEGVQPDWNQNNETAADYVKNRPFYTDDPVETVFVEESTVTFDKIGDTYRAQFPSTFEATVGETYKVSWDGASYECTCVNSNEDNMPVIGNLSILGSSFDTGEPFVIGVNNGKGISIITADTSASHTFSISGAVVPVAQIDPKYIDDMYYTEMLEKSIEGIKIVDLPTSGTLNHNLPLEIGQVWSIGIELVDGKIIPPSHPDYINLEVQRAEDETLYIGTYPDASHLPFCITPTSVETNRQWVHSSNIAFLVLFGVSGAIHEEVVHQIPIKYISAFEGNSIILPSSTENSTKKFRITVDDSGALTATEAT